MRARDVADVYDDAAAGYDERHARDARTRRRAAVLDGIQLDAARAARRVLEIGCGTGRLLAQVSAPVRVGVDVSSRMLAHAAGRGLAVARADAHALPFADRTFDAILAGKGVFRYLEPTRAFVECARVLRPGGVLVVHQYGARTLAWHRTRPPAGVWHLDGVDDVIAPARRAGLALRTIRLFRSVRIPPYLLEIPPWLDRRLPVQLWSHCIAVLVRGA